MRNFIKLLFIVIALSNCTRQFDELAVNPNKTGEVIPGLLLTGISLNLRSSSNKPLFYSQMLCRQVVLTERVEDYQYYRFGRSGFNNYSVLRNVEKMVEEAERTGENVYIGLAHFFRAWFYFDLTMAFGDVPFTEAMKGESGDIYNPAYDTQENIFMGILNELEKANEVLMNADDNIMGDIIFDGNVMKWRKATNTFALRVLMTLSAKEESSGLKVKQRFNNIISNPQNYPLMASNDDNLMFTFADIDGERYPFFNSSFQQYPHIDEFLLNILKERGDKRLFYYAQPTGEAIASGIPKNSFDAYNGGDGTHPLENIQQQEVDKKMSRIHKRYYTNPVNEPYVVLGFAEQELVIAEAAWRAWIDKDAEQHYNNGIRASMKFYETYGESYDGAEISAEYISEYLQNAHVKYDESKGLEQIITQKYIACFIHCNWLQYYEYRRTGFPKLKINTATSLNTGNEDRIPVRWMYPQSESEVNKKHVEEAIKRQYGEDNVNALMWLLK